MRKRRHSDEELLELRKKYKSVESMARAMDYSVGHLKKRLTEATIDPAPTDFKIVVETGTYKRYYVAHKSDPISHVENISDLQCELPTWDEFEPATYEEIDLIDDPTVEIAIRKII